uniref:FunJ3 n=1 Tax=Streptosporangium sp. KD35 TaxID=2162663 RepID=A0A2U9KCY6_9ACTN|nr:FunJ3 [Streptosporangium sp. KD35]
MTAPAAEGASDLHVVADRTAGAGLARDRRVRARVREGRRRGGMAQAPDHALHVGGMGRSSRFHPDRPGHPHDPCRLLRSGFTGGAGVFRERRSSRPRHAGRGMLHRVSRCSGHHHRVLDRLPRSQPGRGPSAADAAGRQDRGGRLRRIRQRRAVRGPVTDRRHTHPGRPIRAAQPLGSLVGCDPFRGRYGHHHPCHRSRGTGARGGPAVDDRDGDGDRGAHLGGAEFRAFLAGVPPSVGGLGADSQPRSPGRGCRVGVSAVTSRGYGGPGVLCGRGAGGGKSRFLPPRLVIHPPRNGRYGCRKPGRLPSGAIVAQWGLCESGRRPEAA